MIVLDASVAAKWVIAEADSAAANELLEASAHLAAPAIVRIEVAGAILRRYRTGNLQQEHARAACDRWQGLLDDHFLRLIPDDELFIEALDLSFQIRHTLVDCMYLAAARMLDSPLITADRALHERGKAVHDRIELLARAA